MKFWFAVASLAAMVASPALADTINFGQWGPNGHVVANGTSGVTGDGVSFTVTGPGTGFTVNQDGVSWSGGFPSGDLILLDQGAGAVTIDFSTPISEIGGFTLSTNSFGAFNATLTAYDGGTQIGTDVISGDSAIRGPAGPSFSFSGSNITSIVITSTNDGNGFALGSTVPEPAAWALMLFGVGGLGAALRRRRKLALA